MFMKKNIAELIVNHFRQQLHDSRVTQPFSIVPCPPHSHSPTHNASTNLPLYYSAQTGTKVSISLHIDADHALPDKVI